MSPDKIMQSDLSDILFENRNKTYGAYALRKSYNKTIATALGATVLLTAFLILVIFLHHDKQQDYITTVALLPDANLSSFKPDDPKPPQPSHIKSANNIRQVNTSTPVITSDNIKSTQPAIADIDKSLISNITTTGDSLLSNIVETLPGNSINGQSSSTAVAPAIENELPLISVDVMPEFPGGINALIKFIQKNIKQPDDLQTGEKIKVIASFVVSKDGTIGNMKIISSGRADLDKDVLRVISKMPLWKPGMQKGKAVAVYFNLPVTFQSADE